MLRRNYKREALADSTLVAGGFAAMGAIGTGAITAVYEVSEKVGFIEEFSATTGFKIAGGFGLLATGIISTSEYLSRS